MTEREKLDEAINHVATTYLLEGYVKEVIDAARKYRDTLPKTKTIYQVEADISRYHFQTRADALAHADKLLREGMRDIGIHKVMTHD